MIHTINSHTISIILIDTIDSLSNITSDYIILAHTNPSYSTIISLYWAITSNQIDVYPLNYYYLDHNLIEISKSVYLNTPFIIKHSLLTSDITFTIDDVYDLLSDYCKQHSFIKKSIEIRGFSHFYNTSLPLSRFNHVRHSLSLGLWYPYQSSDIYMHTADDYKFIQDIVFVLNNNNIGYFFHGGIAIGLLRDNKLIPWDDDVDLCIKLDDVELFRSIKHHLEQRNIFMTDITYNNTFAGFALHRYANYLSKAFIVGSENRNFYCDIMIYYIDDADHNYIRTLGDYGLWDMQNIRFPSHDFLPSITVSLNHIDISIYKNYDTTIKQCYPNCDSVAFIKNHSTNTTIQQAQPWTECYDSYNNNILQHINQYQHLLNQFTSCIHTQHHRPTLVIMRRFHNQDEADLNLTLIRYLSTRDNIPPIVVFIDTIAHLFESINLINLTKINSFYQSIQNLTNSTFTIYDFVAISDYCEFLVFLIKHFNINNVIINNSIFGIELITDIKHFTQSNIYVIYNGLETSITVYDESAYYDYNKYKIYNRFYNHLDSIDRFITKPHITDYFLSLDKKNIFSNYSTHDDCYDILSNFLV